ncbi:MAG: cell wall hydrolase [Sphingomicrobium sp.]
MNINVGRRGLAVALGMFLSVFGGAPASAQTAASLKSDAVIATVSIDRSAQPLGAATATATATATTAVATTAVAAAVSTVSQTFGQKPFATEANWLHAAGWPLYALVDRYQTADQLDEQMTCLATAVYFEARGESVDGQLAVARVVMNRAASGKYPPSWCATVKQPWQFSFVQNGHFPRVDTSSPSWARAQAVAKLAAANVVANLTTDVLWYHADYVAPSWGRRLARVSKIGAHIFYRA